MATGGYQWHISNYADVVNSYDEVSYNSERRVGYDANTGLNKAINTIGAGGSALASLGGLAGAVATSDPVSAISGASSTAVSLVKAIDQIGQKSSISAIMATSSELPEDGRSLPGTKSARPFQSVKV